MDKYTHHLYALVKGKTDLRVTKDIVSLRGDLLFKAGSLMSPEDYQEIDDVRLDAPLEESVLVDEKITHGWLYDEINGLIEKDISFSSIDNELAHASVLKQCCENIRRYGGLDELLTLFRIEMPDLFEQSLYAAYLAYIFAITCKLSQDDVEAAFLAGLLHDVGLLFVSRKITEKKGKLTGEEWSKIKLHPIIGYRLLGEFEGFPENSRKAVLDHHESADGSGYCRGKKAYEISEMASLISVVDDVFVSYKNKFRPQNRTLLDIVPIVQMNTHSYPDNLVASVVQVLKTVEPSEIRNIDIDTLKELIEYIYQQQVYVKRFFELMEKVNKNISMEIKNKKAKQLQESWDKIANTIVSSGIQKPSYVDWLIRAGGSSREDVYVEAEHHRLMLEEVMYQINSYYNYVNNFLSKGLGKVAEDFKVFVYVYSIAGKPEVPHSVRRYWEGY